MKSAKIGILITSCFRQSGRLKKTLWVYSSLDCPVVLGYDGKKLDIETDDIKVFVTGKELGKQFGEHKQISMGSKMLLEMGCEYIFKTCGDILVAKPFEILELVHKLRGYQFLCNQWDVKKEHFGTQLFFGRLEPLVEVTNEIEKGSNNAQDDKEIVQQSGHKYKILSGKLIEVVYGEVMRRLRYKYKVMDDIDQQDGERLWRDGLGCEHLR